MFAVVAVDAALDGDRLFHYRVPPGLGPVSPGARVRVPFGTRRAEGWVVALTDTSPLADSALRDVEDVLGDVPPLDPHLLELAAEVAARWCALYVQALRAMVPADVRTGRVRARTEERLYAVGTEGPAGPKQRAAWELLRRQPGLTRTALMRLAGCSDSVVRSLERVGLAEVRRQVVRRDPAAWEPEPEGEGPPRLTPEQDRAVAALARALDGPQHRVFLLHGVTGSGKTEVYLRAIERVVAGGRQAVVLVPEIALTPQTVARFRARFGRRVAVLHSGLGAGERHDEWWRIRRGEVDVAVGARSAVFAPFPRLGLVVVDEEHETSYKQEEVPRYHARDVALRRGALAGVPVLLGSATPAVESYHAALTGAYTLLELPRRVGDRPLPAVEVVDLREEAWGPDSLFSRRLEEAMAERLARGEQTILFLNRRGFSTAVICPACGLSLRCQRCAVAMTYHRWDGWLRCHWCGARRRLPPACPRCGARSLRLLGAGTEKVEALVRERFPGARVLRMDLDTTGGKGSHSRIYHQFRRGEADVLVGTQMVAKGWDVAGVTLVGVIHADTSLHLPDFRAAERTFQLLCQVAGRAGRGERPGEVVVQTHSPDHYAVAAAREQDAARFYAEEIAARRQGPWPPFTRLVRLVVAAPVPGEAAGAARALAAAVRSALPRDAEMLGPSEAPLRLLRGEYRWHLALRGPDEAALREAARDAALAVTRRRGDPARITIDVDPVWWQ